MHSMHTTQLAIPTAKWGVLPFSEITRVSCDGLLPLCASCHGQKYYILHIYESNKLSLRQTVSSRLVTKRAMRFMLGRTLTLGGGQALGLGD